MGEKTEVREYTGTIRKGSLGGPEAGGDCTFHAHSLQDGLAVVLTVEVPQEPRKWEDIGWVTSPDAEMPCIYLPREWAGLKFHAVVEEIIED